MNSQSYSKKTVGFEISPPESDLNNLSPNTSNILNISNVGSDCNSGDFHFILYILFIINMFLPKKKKNNNNIKIRAFIIFFQIPNKSEITKKTF